MHSKKLLTLVLTATLLVAGCKNKIQKGYDFVREYNEAAYMFKNDLIYRTEAKIQGERALEEIIIDIDFDLNLKKEECKEDIGAKMLPKTISSALVMDQAGDLIKDGATVNLTFRSLDNFILEKIKLDKAMMDKLLAENKGLENSEISFGTSKNAELQKILGAINSSLPLENEQDHTKLLKMELDKGNSLVCITEVPDEFATMLRDPETVAFLKENMLRDEKVKKLLEMKKTYNISKVIYRYQNTKRKTIANIVID
ncbi:MULTISPECIES: hypothetical protein [unclassified Flavobacterium]|uniref:hypothetical protein n=1 Tax=unclassified Flavobacterium TaxID=196869 RepID=UPI003618AC7C